MSNDTENRGPLESLLSDTTRLTELVKSVRAKRDEECLAEMKRWFKEPEDPLRPAESIIDHMRQWAKGEEES